MIENEHKVKSNLPMFSGEDSICSKCGGRGTADVSWVPPGTWTGMPGEVSQILDADEFAKRSADQKGLMLRNCICGYSWTELPLDWDSSGPAEDPRDGEVAALRKLVGHVYVSIPDKARHQMAVEHPVIMRLAKLIAQDWGSSLPVAPEDNISSAAPYFAPLRPDGE